jgi:hypothetical protein
VIYTIQAHETVYSGVRFRSRLEARWAAFFDLLKWKWEYEPLDLGGWVPDFVLTQGNILCEVKPFLDIPAYRDGGPFSEVMEKMERCSIESGRESLLLGARIFEPKYWGDAASIGLLGVLSEKRVLWQRAVVEQTSGFMPEYGPYTDRITGADDLRITAAAAVLADWKEAGNRTQWRAAP